jgi:hypothetical protein
LAVNPVFQADRAWREGFDVGAAGAARRREAGWCRQMRGRFGAGVVVTSAAVALAIAPSCGSRSPLEVGARSERPDASAGFGGAAGAPAGGGSAGAVGLGGSAGAGGAAGVGGGVSCLALATGSAVELLSFPDRHATAPSALLLPELSPPRVALQAMASGGSSTAHSDIQLARFLPSDGAPAGVELEVAPILVGIESHGWANMVHAPGTLREIALTWHGDPGGYGRPMFRRIDVDGWTPGSAVDVAPSGEAVLDTAPGKGTGAFGVGYAGDGYAVVWRRVLAGAQTEPVVGVLGENGSIMLGPHAVAEATDYPGRSPSVIWSGLTYLLATSYGAEGIRIARVRPASGDAVDDSGVELATVLPVSSGMRAGRPALALAEGDVIVAWLERPLEGLEGPSRVRVVRAKPDGSAGVDSLSLAAGNPESRVTLHADSAGVVVIWAETGDASLPDSAPGRSRIVVARLGSALAAPVVWAQIPSPRFHDYGPPRIASRGTAGGLLAVWGARAQTGGLDLVYGARLDCVPHTQYDVKYDAFWGPPMALDRFYVVKRDFTRNVCFGIGLAHPNDNLQFAIALPDQWSVEALFAQPDAFGCPGPGWPPDAVWATSGSGAVDWLGSTAGALPCTLDVAVSMTFQPDLPWLPANELLTASALPVVGAPCGG